jgi:serine/threonine protein phosphatase PrpC
MSDHGFPTTLVVAIIRDITRSKPAEQKFRDVLESAPDGLVIVYVLGRGGEPRAALESTALPLGLEQEDCFPTGPETILEPGDLVLLLTDGIAETMSSKGTFFDPQGALEVVRALRDFSGNAVASDDITAVVIKVADAG